MNIDKLRELKRGEEVTVITKGQYQLVDVASTIKFPPKTEVKTPLTPFVENQLRLGNLTLAGENDAPKATGESTSADKLNYGEGIENQTASAEGRQTATHLEETSEKRRNRGTRTDNNSQGLKSKQEPSE